MKILPYRVSTATGDVLEIDFPLHPETTDAVRVGQLISAFLTALEQDRNLAGEVSNGDVLQALAMTLAIRTGMIHDTSDVSANASRRLLEVALSAVALAERSGPAAGHA